MRDDDDREDLDDRTLPEWCSDCNALVTPKRVDHGIGPWECHGRGVHHDWRPTCPDCGGTDLAEPPAEESESA